MIEALLISTFLLFFLSDYIFVRKIKKVKELNKALTDELMYEKSKPLIIGKITKYKESDLQYLDLDTLEILLQVLEYKIAITTDTIRSLDNTEKKVGYLDCLHELHLFFYKLKDKFRDKETKELEDLV